MTGGTERQTITEGLAALAVTYAEMGATDGEAQELLLGWLVRLSPGFDAALVREAAVAVSSLPEPEDEAAEDLERHARVRGILGVPSAAEQLTASLRAREWLEQLADAVE